MSLRERERSDGTTYWQVMFREKTPDGTRQASLSWDNPDDAERCDQLIKKLGPVKAREILRLAAPDSKLTLTAWLTRHIDHLTGVEPATITRYRAYVRNDITPTIGDIPLTALNREDIAGWVSGLQEDGASGKTVANKHGFVAGALNAAVKDGKLKSNPCDDTRLPRWDREDMVFLERDEFALLLEHVSAYWRPLVRFLVASGCRWGEATALQPKHVDVKAGTVRIRQAWKSGDGGYQLGVPKTKMSVRTINVPADVLADLDLTGKWVFTNSGRGKGNYAGGKTAEDDSVVRAHNFHPNVWTPAVNRAQAAGLAKRPRVHDLRHTCASWLIAAGRPLPAIQAQLGHESITTTCNVYGHLDRESGQGNADAIAAMLR